VDLSVSSVEGFSSLMQDWPIIVQAIVVILGLALSLLLLVAVFSGSVYVLYRLSTYKPISNVVGLIGYSFVLVFAWALWIALPVVAFLQVSSPLTVLFDSLAIYLPLFVFVSLLAKDNLERVNYWRRSDLGGFGKLFEISLLMLPLFVPLLLRTLAQHKSHEVRMRYLRNVSDRSWAA
jgi:hypothetical protein